MITLMLAGCGAACAANAPVRSLTPPRENKGRGWGLRAGTINFDLVQISWADHCFGLEQFRLHISNFASIQPSRLKFRLPTDPVCLGEGADCRRNLGRHRAGVQIAVRVMASHSSAGGAKLDFRHSPPAYQSPLGSLQHRRTPFQAPTGPQTACKPQTHRKPLCTPRTCW